METESGVCTFCNNSRVINHKQIRNFLNVLTTLLHKNNGNISLSKLRKLMSSVEMCPLCIHKITLMEQYHKRIESPKTSAAQSNSCALCNENEDLVKVKEDWSSVYEAVNDIKKSKRINYSIVCINCIYCLEGLDTIKSQLCTIYPSLAEEFGEGTQMDNGFSPSTLSKRRAPNDSEDLSISLKHLRPLNSPSVKALKIRDQDKKDKKLYEKVTFISLNSNSKNAKGRKMNRQTKSHKTIKTTIFGHKHNKPVFKIKFKNAPLAKKHKIKTKVVRSRFNLERELKKNNIDKILSVNLIQEDIEKLVVKSASIDGHISKSPKTKGARKMLVDSPDDLLAAGEDDLNNSLNESRGGKRKSVTFAEHKNVEIVPHNKNSDSDDMAEMPKCDTPTKSILKSPDKSFKDSFNESKGESSKAQSESSINTSGLVDSDVDDRLAGDQDDESDDSTQDKHKRRSKRSKKSKNDLKENEDISESNHNENSTKSMKRKSTSGTSCSEQSKKHKNSKSKKKSKNQTTDDKDDEEENENKSHSIIILENKILKSKDVEENDNEAIGEISKRIEDLRCTTPSSSETTNIPNEDDKKVEDTQSSTEEGKPTRQSISGRELNSLIEKYTQDQSKCVFSDEEIPKGSEDKAEFTDDDDSNPTSNTELNKSEKTNIDTVLDSIFNEDSSVEEPPKLTYESTEGSSESNTLPEDLSCKPDTSSCMDVKSDIVTESTEDKCSDSYEHLAIDSAVLYGDMDK